MRPAPPGTMLRKYGLAPAKGRGQNFLADRNAAAKVVEAVGPDPGDIVVEVGPGFGAITFGLVERSRHVVAVELDSGIAAAFRSEYGDVPGLELVEGDFLDLDLDRVARERDASELIVAGNLPYAITSPVLERIVEARDVVRRSVVMVQAEVGARLAAEPGDPDYSALTVMLGSVAGVRRLFQVRRTCFVPRPAVDSAVIEIDLAHPPELASRASTFEGVVRAAFGRRRKMLRSALRPLLEPVGVTTDELCAASGIDLRRRGETLSVNEFDRLAVSLDRLERAG
ncbi:MAG: ribosomal RNA small subunit methyltransferase A [Candidatus Eisenbacteria bacterium]|nr:ribosomal RNA small subunit methyltransferase A [Candidatus Eisenbacteria bacterium]